MQSVWINLIAKTYKKRAYSYIFLCNSSNNKSNKAHLTLTKKKSFFSVLHLKHSILLDSYKKESIA